jgi:hypothetical protein
MFSPDPLDAMNVIQSTRMDYIRSVANPYPSFKVAGLDVSPFTACPND